ncbi:MAG: MmcQ/YjbR family DNA-binding protein [Ignavibacteriales bacterium]|nr:MmcQ/YjbR family DNA-binding protein [Ignavibacteriales bacterium]
MNPDAIREYSLNKKGKITEGFPFGEGVLVFKVEGKIFLLMNLDEHPVTMNLKCEPGLALDLRERYEAVRPGYHMNKTHWNTIVLDGSIPLKELRTMIDHSYEQIVRGMKKSLREKLLPEDRREPEQKDLPPAIRERERTRRPR